MDNPVIVIPSLHPDGRLITLIKELGAQLPAFPVLIVDDGSGPDDAHFFEECRNLGCTVLTHEVNRGKGAALKTAVRHIRQTYGNETGMITADADGQHLPKDIARVAEDMKAHPEAVVLGSRDFGEGTPWKSLFGNRITSVFFAITTGRRVKDTQTGLRGIPASLMPLSEEVEGDRYEYEMNFLMDAALVAPFHTTTIETVYFDENKGSHFHPVRDAARVYGRFIRFFVSSVGGFLVDILLFMLLMKLLPGTFEVLPITDAPDGSGFITNPALYEDTPVKIAVATVIARICSGIFNFLLNKYYTFRSKKRASGEAVRYFILFVCQMAASACFTALLNEVLHVPTGAKIIVDVILFFISYRIQRAWVFR